MKKTHTDQPKRRPWRRKFTREFARLRAFVASLAFASDVKKGIRDA